MVSLSARLTFVSAKISSRFLSPRRAASMEASGSSSNCALVLCGKSAAETEIAESLRHRNALKLADNDAVSALLRSESDERFEEDAFRIDGFMDSLATKRFGRFLLWSPRLPSTHDVVSL